MCMLDDLRNEEIIIEIKNLINDINNVKEGVNDLTCAKQSLQKAKEGMNIYCDLMKQMFLSGSSQN